MVLFCNTVSDAILQININLKVSSLVLHLKTPLPHISNLDKKTMQIKDNRHKDVYLEFYSQMYSTGA